MKSILISIIAASLAFAAHKKTSDKSEQPIFVIADNPAFGEIVALTLDDAKSQAKQLTSLDPVCNVVPAVCEARYEVTSYTEVFKDGSTKQVQ